MEATSLLFALLRHAVCGEELNDEVKCACIPESGTSVYPVPEARSGPFGRSCS